MTQKKIALVLEPVEKEKLCGDCENCKHFTPSFEDKHGIWGECWFDKKKLFRAVSEYGCKYFELRI